MINNKMGCFDVNIVHTQQHSQVVTGINHCQSTNGSMQASH